MKRRSAFGQQLFHQPLAGVGGLGAAAFRPRGPRRLPGGLGDIARGAVAVMTPNGSPNPNTPQGLYNAMNAWDSQAVRVAKSNKACQTMWIQYIYDVPCDQVASALVRPDIYSTAQSLLRGYTSTAMTTDQLSLQQYVTDVLMLIDVMYRAANINVAPSSQWYQVRPYGGDIINFDRLQIIGVTDTPRTWDPDPDILAVLAMSGYRFTRPKYDWPAGTSEFCPVTTTVGVGGGVTGWPSSPANNGPVSKEDRYVCNHPTLDWGPNLFNAAQALARKYVGVGDMLTFTLAMFQNYISYLTPWTTDQGNGRLSVSSTDLQQIAYAAQQAKAMGDITDIAAALTSDTGKVVEGVVASALVAAGVVAGAAAATGILAAAGAVIAGILVAVSVIPAATGTLADCGPSPFTYRSAEDLPCATTTTQTGGAQAAITHEEVVVQQQALNTAAQNAQAAGHNLLLANIQAANPSRTPWIIGGGLVALVVGALVIKKLRR